MKIKRFFNIWYLYSRHCTFYQGPFHIYILPGSVPYIHFTSVRYIYTLYQGPFHIYILPGSRIRIRKNLAKKKIATLTHLLENCMGESKHVPYKMLSILFSNKPSTKNFKLFEISKKKNKFIEEIMVFYIRWLLGTRCARLM